MRKILPLKNLTEGEIRKRGNYVDRATRLRNLAKNLELVECFPMLYGARVGEALYGDLVRSVEVYILASLRATYPTQSFEASRDLLVRYYKQIKGLVNLTPNGLVMPKRENVFEFNLIHRHVANILKTFRSDALIDEIHLPVMVRLVDGIVDTVSGKRPYSSTKLHVDMWNGDPPNAMTVFIPVIGDIERTTIDFFEPQEEMMKNFMRVMPDYEEGAEMIASASQYIFKMRHKHVYIADPLLLHRTVKKNGGIRVSIDLRFIPKKRLASDVISGEGVQTNWKRNFIKLKNWYEVGQSRFLNVAETFEDTIKKYIRGRGKKTEPIDYAEYFKMVDLF